MDSRPERLSSTQWAWTNDRAGFEKRLNERAENLWLDNYYLEPCEEVGVFAIGNDKGSRHLVNIITRTCTCPFMQKAEIPGCECKHLRGFGSLNPDTGLIAEQLGFYFRQARQHELAGWKDRANERWSHWHGLIGAWNAALPKIEEREAAECEMDVECYRKWKAGAEQAY